MWCENFNGFNLVKQVKKRTHAAMSCLAFFFTAWFVRDKNYVIIMYWNTFLFSPLCTFCFILQWYRNIWIDKYSRSSIVLFCGGTISKMNTKAEKLCQGIWKKGKILSFIYCNQGNWQGQLFLKAKLLLGNPNCQGKLGQCECQQEGKSCHHGKLWQYRQIVVIKASREERIVSKTNCDIRKIVFVSANRGKTNSRQG